MTAPPPRGRRGMRRVVVVMPSAFTLGNLFFGFWSIVYASQGRFAWAGWFIVFAGILDMLDGRVARLSNTGSRFGAELDSLVDVISFGVAPALLMYFLEFQNGGRFAWILCYIYVVATALRLARYNVTAGTHAPSSWFTGMPSPSAGMTLAVYYPFTQTEWYQRSMSVVDFGQQGLAVLMLLLALLMVSNVKYPRFPPIGLRSARGIFGLAVHLLILIGGIVAPESFLFPLGITYLAFGLVRATILGLMQGDREPGDSDAPSLSMRRPGWRRRPQEPHE
ncbi:MAG TPA: CDP-diacylglycerol--serine O-phosphatidyltransferase [Gemmatimonadales bacterium]|nr:CDP-diacylglycerol--serine O-phosphatidyltransferase [Gemmatimonadales bacterium]